MAGWSDYLRQGLWRIDLELARTYSLGRAHRISMRERPAGGGGAFAYGETPWAIMTRILDLTEAGPDDTFLELGSGTGRFALFAARIRGLQAVGVERIPTFVRRGNEIAGRLSIDRCSFREADLFEVSWRRATVLYLTATTFSDEAMERVEAKCSELAPGARLVTTTRSPEVPGLERVAMDVLDFSWGPATLFVQRRG